MSDREPIWLVVPTGDSSPGTSQGSAVIVPSCDEDVWAWLHTLRTGEDLPTVESVERASRIEWEAFQRQQRDKSGDGGGSK
jgi:hypothetical protein